MYKLCFFVPESHVEQVKAALFAQGAGKIGEYDCCAWQVLGTGQFKPLAASQPFIGETGKITTLDEYKVEMVCDDQLIKQVVVALLQAHPYQEPAYDVTKILSLSDLPE
ncbi:Bsu YqfO NIF3/CutA domain [Bathymodiolus heckerae thiotrophic gill symbiont]|uniref:Nif3-like dinuclear metal center hexameric protein n=1 Tax=Bathymodiolus heckerae thiotrophic gill symbiont TaxID=1052212 RepID=UPI0010B0876F|nr:YqfO family protein [Bathymodiolus heckerae thiotrophic gill symbiont]SHN92271.1 Bsu YqfO NIF3/CutA domain [Bathymodiolus heckerae thiotrophic gill symbiont]